jgi:hypothetical protein
MDPHGGTVGMSPASRVPCRLELRDPPRVVVGTLALRRPTAENDTKGET